jgi:DNA primase
VALPLLTPDRTLRFATLPPGEDPDTLIARQGEAGMQAVLTAARPLAEALFGIIAGAKLPEAPEPRAQIRNRLAGAANTIPDKALAAEFRRSLLDRFFAQSKRPGRAAAPRHPRPVPNALAIRAERARMIMAICLRHPTLLPEVEEPLALLDFPEGPAKQVRDAVFAWIRGAERLDSAELIAHLRDSPAAEACALVLREAGLPPEARPGSQPKEALDAFWQMFGFLRGEAELAEDARAAAAALAETNDAAAQARLIRLTMALDALRRGEVEDVSAAG